MRRIYFVPFLVTEAGSAEVATVALDLWHAHEATSGYVRYTGEPNWVMAKAHALTNIYILGHHFAGAHAISTTTGRGTACIDAIRLRLRLTQSGLPQQFRGGIKCFNCQSGLVHEEGAESFAQEFSGVLAQENLPEEDAGKPFHGVWVWGYVGDVSKYPATPNRLQAHAVNLDGSVRYNTAGKPIPQKIQTPTDSLLRHHTVSLTRNEGELHEERVVMGRAKNHRVVFRDGKPYEVNEALQRFWQDGYDRRAQYLPLTEVRMT